MNKPIKAIEAAPKAIVSNYPEPFFSMMSGRQKRALGDLFGLSSFGVNLTTLEPNAMSALYHEHSVSQEFIYILEGCVTLSHDGKEIEMNAGDCIGFQANQGAHHLINKSESKVVYLEIGDRLPNDTATYPNDDITAEAICGKWVFKHKDGTPY